MWQHAQLWLTGHVTQCEPFKNEGAEPNIIIIIVERYTRPSLMTKAEVVAINLSPLIILISHILSIHILIHYNTTLTCFNTTNLSPEFDYLVLYGSNSSTVLPRKDSMVTQCWSNVSPPSKTLAQLSTSIGWLYWLSAVSYCNTPSPTWWLIIAPPDSVVLLILFILHLYLSKSIQIYI